MLRGKFQALKMKNFELLLKGEGYSESIEELWWEDRRCSCGGEGSLFLNTKFDYVLCVIEESKGLESMKI